MENLINGLSLPEVVALISAILGVLKVVVNLTPSEKDNKVFEILDRLFDAIVPNLKKGGGAHKKNIIPGVNKKWKRS